MRKTIIAWVKTCAHCISTGAMKRFNSELLFSWPVTAPFWILHIDLWQPGAVSDKDGFKYLLNAMCDLSQFVISVPIKNADAATIAKALLQDILFKVGLCGVIVVDDGSGFKATVIDICSILRIRWHLLSKDNHKVLSS